MANRYKHIKIRYRIHKGVRYISYRTFNTYEEAKFEVWKLKLYGVQCLKPYNNWTKCNFIVFVKEIKDDE